MRWCIVSLGLGVGVVLWLSSFFSLYLVSPCEGGFSCSLFGFYDRLYESFCSHSERIVRVGVNAVSNVAKGRLGIVSVISFYCINILWYGLGYVALRIFNLCR